MEVRRVSGSTVRLQQSLARERSVVIDEDATIAVKRYSKQGSSLPASSNPTPTQQPQTSTVALAPLNRSKVTYLRTRIYVLD